MRILRTIIIVSMLLTGALSTSSIAPTPQVSAQNCTFTATTDNIILRSGPGREYAEVGRLYEGDTLAVVGRDVGIDLYIWWEGPNDVWVRSDLGDSDCDSLCGDTICEYGEDAASCPDDCSGIAASSSGSCLVPDCQSCYESVDCYPDCNNCTCDANEFGCTTCFCDYGDSSPVTDVATGGGGVVTTYADISCTFIASRDLNLRDGPGTEYAIIGETVPDQTISIVARDVGADTYVWWKTANDEWVRSDLGENDCPNLCGDGVCEIDEDESTCAADCGTTTVTTTAASITSSTSCLVDNCEDCYESVDCYPDCGNCTCDQDAEGCPTCFCTY